MEKGPCWNTGDGFRLSGTEAMNANTFARLEDSGHGSEDDAQSDRESTEMTATKTGPLMEAIAENAPYARTTDASKVSR